MFWVLCRYRHTSFVFWFYYLVEMYVGHLCTSLSQREKNNSKHWLISSSKVRLKIWHTLRNSHDSKFDYKFQKFFKVKIPNANRFRWRNNSKYSTSWDFLLYYFFFCKKLYINFFYKVGFSQRIDSCQKTNVGASSLCLLSLESDSVFLSLSVVRFGLVYD